MIPSLDNILKSISDSKNCQCRLKQYRASHSLALIEISRESLNSVYLAFEEVQYIECPISWQGADIYLGPVDECVQILHKLKKGFEELPESYLAEKYRLYKFQHPDFQIQVLANSIYLSKDSPSI
jgi:hypothetical protein